MHPPITALYAALLALLFLRLSLNVIRIRLRTRIAFGVGGDAGLERAARVQANFAEYTPLLLLLIFLVEVSSYPAWTIHLLGAVLLAGRGIHAYGVSREPEDSRFRSAGMISTFGVLLASAAMLLAACVIQALSGR